MLRSGRDYRDTGLSLGESQKSRKENGNFHSEHGNLVTDSEKGNTSGGTAKHILDI